MILAFHSQNAQDTQEGSHDPPRDFLRHLVALHHTSLTSCQVFILVKAERECRQTVKKLRVRLAGLLPALLRARSREPCQMPARNGSRRGAAEKPGDWSTLVGGGGSCKNGLPRSFGGSAPPFARPAPGGVHRAPWLRVHGKGGGCCAARAGAVAADGELGRRRRERER
jgi:hypothetical protein